MTKDEIVIELPSTEPFGQYKGHSPGLKVTRSDDYSLIEIIHYDEEKHVTQMVGIRKQKIDDFINAILAIRQIINNHDIKQSRWVLLNDRQIHLEINNKILCGAGGIMLRAVEDVDGTDTCPECRMVIRYMQSYKDIKQLIE